MNGRIVDADGNRAAEGLRVLEELARFLLGDAALAARAKELRHELRRLLPESAVAARDTAGDIGMAIKAGDEQCRADLVALLRANAARCQEALRVLEEWGKLQGLRWPEALRYRCYDLERDLLAALPAWRLRGVRLYALIDTALTDQPLRVAAAVVRGGAGAVQLRAKDLTPRAYRDLAAAMLDTVTAAGALFAVNDHVAIAAALAAPLVHVGQDDLAVADVRRVVGPLCAVGLSCHTPQQVDAAQAAGADYLGLGPMFATATKPAEAERGPGLLDAVRDRLARPSYAIGGLDGERVLALGERIPHGIAVAGALCRAEDPQRVAAELVALVEEAERA